jgi:hypothetical protein
MNLLMDKSLFYRQVIDIIFLLIVVNLPTDKSLFYRQVIDIIFLSSCDELTDG